MSGARLDCAIMPMTQRNGRVFWHCSICTFASDLSSRCPFAPGGSQAWLAEWFDDLERARSRRDTTGSTAP